MKLKYFVLLKNGSIKVGENFVEVIFEELDNGDIFIPIISEDYIYSFALYPVMKGQALSGTLLMALQTGDNEKDIYNFLRRHLGRKVCLLVLV